MHALPTIAAAVALVFSIIALGVLVRRLNWLTAEADASLVRLTVRLLLPCLVISGMGRGDWPTTAVNLVWPPLTGFGLATLGIAVSGGVAYFFGPTIGLHTGPQRRAFALCVGLYNYGYVPIPLVAELFPKDDATLAALLLHNVGIEIAMWTVGVAVLVGRPGKRWWSGVLNPIVIAIGIALFLRIAHVWPLLPLWLTRGLDMLGGTAIPLALLLTGAMIRDVWAAADLRRGWPTVTAACVLRLGVLPLTFFATGRLLHANAELARVLAIQAAMPAAIFPIVLTRHYGGDSPTAVRVVLGSATVGLVTMPLWLYVGLAS